MAKHLPWLLPILAMIILAPFTPWLDLQISNYYYNPETGFERTPFIIFMYDWASWPGILVSVAGFCLFVYSCFSGKCLKWRPEALILALAMLIGAGLIVHVILKDHWGRPRPAQTLEFGGPQPFRPFYSPNFSHPQHAKSFPCGHCSTGFYFFALALVGLRLKNTKLAVWGFILAGVFGLSLSYIRIAMGGHYFSDTVMSALIMWLTAYALYRWVPIYERTE